MSPDDPSSMTSPNGESCCTKSSAGHGSVAALGTQPSGYATEIPCRVELNVSVRAGLAGAATLGGAAVGADVSAGSGVGDEVVAGAQPTATRAMTAIVNSDLYRMSGTPRSERARSDALTSTGAEGRQTIPCGRIRDLERQRRHRDVRETRRVQNCPPSLRACRRGHDQPATEHNRGGHDQRRVRCGRDRHKHSPEPDLPEGRDRTRRPGRSPAGR